MPQNDELNNTPHNSNRRICLVYSAWYVGFKLVETDDVKGVVRTARGKGYAEDAACYYERRIPTALQNGVLMEGIYKQFSWPRTKPYFFPEGWRYDRGWEPLVQYIEDQCAEVEQA